MISRQQCEEVLARAEKRCDDFGFTVPALVKAYMSARSLVDEALRGGNHPAQCACHICIEQHNYHGEEEGKQ